MAGDNGNNGVDGVANQGGAEEVTVTANRFPVSPPPPLQPLVAGDDEEKGVNGSVEDRGGDGEKGVHGVAEGREEEKVVAPAVVSSASCNGTLPHAPSQAEAERMEVEDQGEGRETGEPQLPNDRDARSSNDQGMGKVFDVMPLAVAAPISCGANVSNGSVENVRDVASLLMNRRGSKGGCEYVRNEVTSDRDVRETENRVGFGELQRKKDDVHDGGRKKRWLMSAVNPPPKRRAVSAVRKFPPGCGRAASTLAGSGVEELHLEATPVSVASGGASMEDAMARTPISVQGALVPGLDHSSEAIDGKTIEDDESSKVENRIQEFQVATNVDDFEGAKNGSTCPSNIITKPLPRHGFIERVNGKGSPQEKKFVARAFGDGKMTRKCEGRLQEGTLDTRMRDLVDVKAKHKILKSDKLNMALKDDARSCGDGRMKKKASSTQRGVVHSDMNIKQGNIARRVDATGKCKGIMNRLIEEAKSGKHATTNRIEENDDRDFVDDRIIVQALMAPEKCPWTQGRKSIGSASESHTPKRKLKKKVARPRKELKDATPRKDFSLEVPSSKAIKHEAVEDKEDSHSEEEGNSKASYSADEGKPKALVPSNMPQQGEVLQDNEDEQIENDEYLFDIGHNYHDKVWEERKSGIWGLESSTSDTPEDTEGSTIDASKCSNVGRFINHSCSPNLYAQNVLWDHDDKKIPHIMFFASENIPPLQELTYHYNYTVGKLKDKNGNEKVKPCFCGSPDCSGRLY
ncbi:hypothetical protein E2562_020395 [Oryza meyeriana var. granulata]|uniref:SET domain-containing protein n=1 Tax=Oryza meyeriana var. granulata TaxID=110450 RepID=A0A6G1DLG0_9ORYZ|nr:hypothetical protein E2562_020395 [Oryza meyeriana var. granulata]